MAEIKNIVFDFGGVLVNLNPQASMDAFHRLGVPRPADYLTPYGHQGPFGAFENGDIDLPEFRRQLREMFSLQVSDEAVDAAWAAFLEDIPYRKIRLVYALSRRYRLFLLSNTNPIHTRFLEQFAQAGYPAEECFEKMYFSYRIGLSKPGREIFEYVARDAALKPEETLLVDDSPANCAAAASLGWQTDCPRPFEDFGPRLFPEEAALASDESFAPRPLQACVATMGFFDGVHLGHRYLMDQLKELARQRKMPSLVLYFWPHPRRVLQAGYCPPLLTACADKHRLLRQTGVDCVRQLGFDTCLAALSARDFMAEVLKKQYHVKCLLIGYDHHFGHGRREVFEDYRRYGQELGIEVLQAPQRPLLDDFPQVSSSSIRQLLSEGKVLQANQALGYDWFMDGTVVRGYGKGRDLGFPTANLQLTEPDQLVPASGVYSVEVLYGGKSYRGMLNIGTRPTMHNGSERSIEVHIFDFGQDIYGQPLRVILKDYLRPEQAFPSLEALKAQLEADKKLILSRWEQ